MNARILLVEDNPDDHGLSEFLQGDLDKLTHDEIRQDLRAIRDAGRRLHRTLCNYLLLLELEPTAAARPATPVDAEMVSDAPVGGFVAAAGRHQRASNVVTEIVGTRLKVNPVDLATLVEELVDNALSFSRQHTPVHVRAWCEASGLHIVVADTGRGMTPAQFEHLGVFWQRPQDLYQPQNLGLGLMLVHRLVHHLGGQFRIESRAGVGTAAHVTVPMLEA